MSKRNLYENPKANRHINYHEVTSVKKVEGTILLRNKVGQEIEIPRELRSEFIDFLANP
jgi:hypothetical protein